MITPDVVARGAELNCQRTPQPFGIMHKVIPNGCVVPVTPSHEPC